MDSGSMDSMDPGHKIRTVLLSTILPLQLQDFFVMQEAEEGMIIDRSGLQLIFNPWMKLIQFDTRATLNAEIPSAA